MRVSAERQHEQLQTDGKPVAGSAGSEMPPCVLRGGQSESQLRFKDTTAAIRSERTSSRRKASGFPTVSFARVSGVQAKQSTSQMAKAPIWSRTTLY